MEEASVAGESPDRSKQRESSDEPTSGSAGPVPEARNAASTSASGGSAGGSGGAGGTAGAGSGDAGGDGRLRDVVAAWVATADERAAVSAGRGAGGAGAASGADGASGEGEGSGVPEGAAAGVDDAPSAGGKGRAAAGATGDAGTETGPRADAGRGNVAEAGAGAGREDSVGSGAGGGSPADADVDTDAGSRADADAEADAGSRAGAGARTDADAETDADAGPGRKAGTDAGREAEAAAGTKGDAGAEADAGAESGPAADTAPQVDAEAGAGAEDDTRARTDAGLPTGAGTQAGPGREGDGTPESAAEAGAATVAEAKADAGSVGDAGPETGSGATAAAPSRADGRPEAWAGTGPKAGADATIHLGAESKAAPSAKADAESKAAPSARADAEPEGEAAAAPTDSGQSTGARPEGEEPAEPRVGAKGDGGLGVSAVPESDGKAEPAAGTAAAALAGPDRGTGTGTDARPEPADPDRGTGTGTDARPEDVDQSEAGQSKADGRPGPRVPARTAAAGTTAVAEPGDADDTGDADDADTPEPGTPAAEGDGGDAKPSASTSPAAPVDHPTTALKAPRLAAGPPVDQPTTMLKLPEREGERTSKFVRLRDAEEARSRTAPVGATALSATAPAAAERTTQQPMPPKPPLDLLAELTNTPPPPETPLRTTVRRVKIWTPLVLLLAVLVGIAQAVRPLPDPTLDLTAKDSFTFQGGKPDIPWPAKGQAALDVQGIGTFGSSGAQKPVPIASVAKIMTAYLVLRDHPVKSGDDGASIQIDQTAESQSKAGQESTVDVFAGDKISQREALESILIASANNVARLLARWDAGNEKAFVEKMNAAAKSLGMTNTTYTDPSGLNNTTVSTAMDQVKLAKAAMQQPVFREVAAMMSYVDYKGVKHSNWNGLVGYNDVVGIKTGTTTSALGNLVFAAKKKVGGETKSIIGAVVRQPEGGADNTIIGGALSAGDKLIRGAQGALASSTILKKGTVVGYVDDGLGGRTPVVATEDVKAVGWPGLTVKVTFTADDVPHTAKAGTRVGTLTVGDGHAAGAVKVPVALQRDLAEPGLGDKLTRIG
ncbi:D-alanyl-D-alanine carboxypeptidase [Streptomyces sp. NPDC003717]|uniref:D-alanyl-D-alanine carboxypeptidase n=1 Tax=Streptomyces sp. NPDC003717 TaxID=3154276 RepID=UPI0033BA2DBF